MQTTALSVPSMQLTVIQWKGVSVRVGGGEIIVKSVSTRTGTLLIE